MNVGDAVVAGQARAADGLLLLDDLFATAGRQDDGGCRQANNHASKSRHPRSEGGQLR
jgi:hypothetical protein